MCLPPSLAVLLCEAPYECVGRVLMLMSKGEKRVWGWGGGGGAFYTFTTLVREYCLFESVLQAYACIRAPSSASTTLCFTVLGFTCDN